ncbi:hypothetical protein ALC53_02623 [Atta colombica]|uniref:Uncharacterized protein n=1 Tax=Atta colombica TaxID=520822 RepID=A0A195BQI7_9HYME|nr:hypothetical protein ALC53_02623 [Atta colombica]
MYAYIVYNVHNLQDILISRWDLSRGHLNFAYARNVLLADRNLLRTRRHLIINNQFNECDEILAYERPYRNVLRFSFQGNENSGDKHEIVSIPFTNPDRLGSPKSYYVIVLGIGWPNCGGL